MAKFGQGRQARGGVVRPAPERVALLAQQVVRALGRPLVPQPRSAEPGFAALRAAACADLLRRFAAPLRVVDVGAVHIVSVLDALAFVHDRARRHVCVGVWQPDGSLVIDTISRIEIGRPLAGFGWIDVLLAQWQQEWLCFADLFARRDVCNRLRNAVRRWLRETVDMRAQRQVFRAALKLDARVVWMAERLARSARAGWLCAGHYSDVGRHWQRLEWVLADSPAVFRLVGLALLEGKLGNPDEPVASTLRLLRGWGVSEAAWRRACQLGPRLFDPVLKLAMAHQSFGACVEGLRLLEMADLQPLPKALQRLLFWQHALPDCDLVDFRDGWCTFPTWFVRNAARAARDAQRRGASPAFVDDELLPALEWLCEAAQHPDANQIRSGWRWIMRAQQMWRVLEEA